MSARLIRLFAGWGQQRGGFLRERDSVSEPLAALTQKLPVLDDALFFGAVSGSSRVCVCDPQGGAFLRDWLASTTPSGIFGHLSLSLESIAAIPITGCGQQLDGAAPVFHSWNAQTTIFNCGGPPDILSTIAPSAAPGTPGTPVMATMSRESRDRRAFVNGELIRGKTNGDDAVYASDYFICANDGVGAWATRPRGHAGLWSRLILHFWSTAIEEERIRCLSSKDLLEPDPVASLQTAYEQTLEATTSHDCLGTTTVCGAQLHFRTSPDDAAQKSPVLYVTNVGDCKVMVLRPSVEKVIYKTVEQWHWFDCPRQLGTNSPDTPNGNAVMDKVDLKEGDIVLAMSDGVIDNLWEHEIVTRILKSVREWESGEHAEAHSGDRTGGRNGGMRIAAQDLMAAAKEIAVDPFAESPFMEHAIEEGLASEGGKLDDISVIAALCLKNEG
ncbi:hypothetical protein ACJ41O_002418 [Fusarium nematophilum]